MVSVMAATAEASRSVGVASSLCSATLRPWLFAETSFFIMSLLPGEWFAEKRLPCRHLAPNVWPNLPSSIGLGQGSLPGGRWHSRRAALASWPGQASYSALHHARTAIRCQPSDRQRMRSPSTDTETEAGAAIASSSSAASGRGFILLLVAVAAVSPLGINIYLPSMPGMAADFGVDFAAIQLTLSLYLLTVAIGQLFIG